MGNGEKKIEKDRCKAISRKNDWNKSLTEKHQNFYRVGRKRGQGTTSIIYDFASSSWSENFWLYWVVKQVDSSEESQEVIWCGFFGWGGSRFLHHEIRNIKITNKRGILKYATWIKDCLVIHCSFTNITLQFENFLAEESIQGINMFTNLWSSIKHPKLLI